MGDFGKLNFSISFNRTSAFPLEANSYFTNLEQAEAAAKTAVEPGSADSTYYIGLTLTVADETDCNLYIINPDLSLKRLTILDTSDVTWESILNKPTVFNTNIDNISDLHSSWDNILKSLKPTTIGGYGITDAYTKVESDNRYIRDISSGIIDGNTYRVYNTDNESGIGIKRNAGFKAFLGAYDTSAYLCNSAATGADYLKLNDNHTLTYRDYVVWHAGNFDPNSKVNKAGDTMNGNLRWAESALPHQTGSPLFLLCIDAFADGGTTKWSNIEDIVVGTAQKLSNNCIIWGHNFNGTNNITGSIILGEGNAIIGKNGVSILKDWNNNNVTLSAAKGDLYIGYDYTGNISFRSGNTNGTGTEKMIILGNGNIGIGTSFPSQKLQVSGNVIADTYILTGANNSDMCIGYYNNRIVAGINVARGFNVGSLLISDSWGDAQYVSENGIWCKGDITSGKKITSAEFYTNNASERHFAALSSVNNSITGTDPDYKWTWYHSKNSEVERGFTLWSYSRDYAVFNQVASFKSYGGNMFKMFGNILATGEIYANTSNKVWHAGNMGSGSGLDADLLDGQHASAFSYKSWWHWSGQSGLPTWVWGGGSENNYYVYNPANFNVNHANSAGSATSATRLLTPRSLWGLSFDGLLNVSGTLSGVSDINATGAFFSSYSSNTYNNSLKYSVINCNISSFGGWIKGNTKDGVIAIATYPGSDNKLYFGYAPQSTINAGINSYTHELLWDGDSGNLIVKGNVQASSGFYEQSDVRLKTNIQPIDFTNNIELVSFNWKESGKKSYGVIAQLVELYYPELVSTDESTGYKSVNYDAVLIIKCALLENRIKQLEKELEDLKYGKDCN